MKKRQICDVLYSHVVETVNRSLHVICSSECPFGGITVVLGSNFQQTLPVLVKGTHKDTILATIQWSRIWSNVSILCLTQNMCLNRDPLSKQFAEWLLNVGHGSTVDSNTGSRSIPIPHEMVCTTEDDLIRSLYGSTPHTSTPPPQYFYNRVLLAPLNQDVQKLNTHILHLFPGVTRMYTSADIQVVTASACGRTAVRSGPLFVQPGVALYSPRCVFRS